MATKSVVPWSQLSSRGWGKCHLICFSFLQFFFCPGQNTFGLTVLRQRRISGAHPRCSVLSRDSGPQIGRICLQLGRQPRTAWHFHAWLKGGTAAGISRRRQRMGDLRAGEEVGLPRRGGTDGTNSTTSLSQSYGFSLVVLKHTYDLRIA